MRRRRIMKTAKSHKNWSIQVIKDKISWTTEQLNKELNHWNQMIYEHDEKNIREQNHRCHVLMVSPECWRSGVTSFRRSSKTQWSQIWVNMREKIESGLSVNQICSVLLDVYQLKLTWVWSRCSLIPRWKTHSQSSWFTWRFTEDSVQHRVWSQSGHTDVFHCFSHLWMWSHDCNETETKGKKH